MEKVFDMTGKRFSVKKFNDSNPKRTLILQLGSSSINEDFDLYKTTDGRRWRRYLIMTQDFSVTNLKFNDSNPGFWI